MEWTMAAQAPMTEATYYILLALMKPGHGYGMMQRIKELSGGRIEMGPGTLYGVLTRMNKEGLITLTSEEGRRKNYAILMPGSNIFGLFTHDRIIFVHTKGFDWVIRRKLIQVKTQVHRFPPGHRI